MVSSPIARLERLASRPDALGSHNDGNSRDTSAGLYSVRPIDETGTDHRPGWTVVTCTYMSEQSPHAAPVSHEITADPDGIQSMHDILSCWKRRALLYYLQEVEEPADVDELAAHLQAWRRGDEEPAAGEDAVDQVREDLRHEHVRKMEEFGVVRYRPATETVHLVDGMTVAVSAPWEHRAAAAVEP